MHTAIGVMCPWPLCWDDVAWVVRGPRHQTILTDPPTDLMYACSVLQLEICSMRVLCAFYARSAWVEGVGEEEARTTTYGR